MQRRRKEENIERVAIVALNDGCILNQQEPPKHHTLTGLPMVGSTSPTSSAHGAEPLTKMKLYAAYFIEQEGLGLGLRSLILLHAVKIQKGQGKLQGHQDIGRGIPSPNNPENIAEKKEPEPHFSFMSGLRCNEPGHKNRHQHGGPLQFMEVINS